MQDHLSDDFGVKFIRNNELFSYATRELTVEEDNERLKRKLIEVQSELEKAWRIIIYLQQRIDEY